MTDNQIHYRYQEEPKSLVPSKQVILTTLAGDDDVILVVHSQFAGSDVATEHIVLPELERLALAEALLSTVSRDRLLQHYPTNWVDDLIG